MTIEWRPDGPPSRKGRGRSLIEPILATLRARPNVWAVVRRVEPARRNTIDSTITTLKQRGACAFRHKNDEGDLEAWAMWPENSQQHPQSNAAPTEE